MYTFSCLFVVFICDRNQNDSCAAASNQTFLCVLCYIVQFVEHFWLIVWIFD